MKQIIATDADKCLGCFSCIGVCPVGEANIAYFKDDKLRVRVNPQKCIVCGSCLRACPNNARYYNDDTERFFGDLKNGVPMALIVAPAFSTNFLNWKAILAWLRTRGVSVIVDVSLGIKICTWAQIRYIERNNKAALITQPCPPIVSYIEKYCPELLNRLSPVFSPILCTAVYLMKVLKLPEKIAALTPCPAKADEFNKSDSVSYNVTIKKLADFLIAHEVSIPKADFEFDNIAVAPGRAHMMLSSLPEYIKRSLGCISLFNSQIKVEITKNHGNVYRYLDLFSQEGQGDTPMLLDALNCIGGCCYGSGCNINKPELQTLGHKPYGVDMENVNEQARPFSAC